MGIRWEQMSFGRRGSGSAAKEESTLGEALAHRAAITTAAVAPLPHSPEQNDRLGAAATLLAKARAVRDRFWKGDSQLTTALQRGDGWTVMDDAALRPRKTKRGEAELSANRVDRVAYRKGIGFSDAKRGFFKPEPLPDETGRYHPNGQTTDFDLTKPPRMAARAVLSSVLDRELGTNVLAGEAFAEHWNAKSKELELGNVSAEVGGRPLKSGRVEVIRDRTSPDRGKRVLVERLDTTTDLSRETTQRGMSNLQVIDWLTGQRDRHGGNIFVDEAGVVRGIDNDVSFPPTWQRRLYDKNVGLPPLVHRRTADAVRRLTPERLRDVLDRGVPASERLTPEEMASAEERLAALKEHLDRHPEVIVDRFDASTYARATESAPEGPRATTYIGAHQDAVRDLAQRGGTSGDVPNYDGSVDGDGNPVYTNLRRYELDRRGVDAESMRLGKPTREAWARPSNDAALESPTARDGFPRDPRERGPSVYGPEESFRRSSTRRTSVAGGEKPADPAHRIDDIDGLDDVDDEGPEVFDEESDPDADVFDEDQRDRIEVLREAAARAGHPPADPADPELPRFTTSDATSPPTGSAPPATAAPRAGGSRAAALGRGVGNLFNRLRNKLLGDRDAVESAPLGPGQEDGFVPLERGEGWVVHTDDGLIRHRPQQDGGMTNVNRVDRVWYGDPRDHGAGSRTGFFKPEPGPGQSSADAAQRFERGGNRYRLAARAVMSSALDKKLGTNVIADEAFAEHLNWATGKTEMGNVSSTVDGTPLRGGYVDKERSSATETTVVQGLYTEAPLRSPEAQRGLSNLQVVDWLTAQVDRHNGNIFMTPEGTVRGIDNDLAFTDEENPEGGFNRGLPPVIHRPTADAILAMSEDDLERVLDGAVPPSERLTRGKADEKGVVKGPNEMAAARARLRALQKHIRENQSTVVVDHFDDATFDRMREQRTGGRDATYLGSFAALAEQAKQGAMVTPVRKYGDDGMTLVATVNNEVVLDNPDADLSSWATGWRPADEPANDGDAGLFGPPFEKVAREAGPPPRGGRNRTRSDAGPPPARGDGRPRAHTFDSAGERGGPSNGPRHGSSSSSSADDGGQQGSNRSGEAETKGDERRLGPGGESGLGEASAYSRFINAFGRNPEAGFQAFKTQWERAALARQQIAIEQAQRLEETGTLDDQVLAAVNDAFPTDAAPTDDGPTDPSAAPAAREPNAPTEDASVDRGVVALDPEASSHANALVLAEDTAAEEAPPARNPARAVLDALGAAATGLRATLSRVPDMLAEMKGRLDRPAVIGDDDLVFQKTTMHEGGGAKTNENRVDRVIYKKPIGNSGSDKGFFKPNTPGNNEATRAVLSSSLDRALGTNVLSTEVFANHRPPWGKPDAPSEFGVVSVGVPGRALQEAKAVPDGNGGRIIERNVHTGIDPRDSRFQEGMANLQTLDFLTGQMDRHNGNIFVDGKGNVRGIDNDWAFGENSGKFAMGKNPGPPPVVPKRTADAISKMSPGTLEKILSKRLPPGQELTEAELEAAKSRLELLKEHLKQPGVVHKKFDDSTYDQSVSHTVPGRGGTQDKGSYLGSFVELTQQVANGKGETPPGTRWAATDPSFQPNSWSPGQSPRQVPPKDLSSGYGSSITTGSTPWGRPDVLTDDQLETKKTVVLEGPGEKTNENRVDRVTYDGPIGGTDTNKGFFKPDGNTNSSTKSVVSTEVDKLLGTSSLSKELYAEHTDFEGNKEFGVVSVSVVTKDNGARPLMDSHVVLRPHNRPRGDALIGGAQPSGPSRAVHENKPSHREIERILASDIDPRDPTFQEGMANLQTVDWLTMQMDRHPGNIFVTNDGHVLGIDNDASFIKSSVNEAMEKNRGLPPQVPAKTASVIENMSRDDLLIALTRNVPPGKELSKGAIDTALERLDMLKEHIKQPGVVKTTFDDSTYEANLAAKNVTTVSAAGFTKREVPGSYLSKFVDSCQQYQLGKKGDEGIKIMPGTDPSAWTKPRPKQDAPSDGDGGRPTISGAPGSQWQSATPGAWNPSGGWQHGRVGLAKAKAAVEANERKGTTTSTAQGTTSNTAAERVGYALKRRNHAGTSLRAPENKKTPARGTKKRASTTSHKKRK